ncbi:MAG: hypothetical protein CM15mP8_4940 [Methanobacteriota archaeon]|nr:MAG: hypothetical protein CM15mP8_4940 [Euryarchaeota archaeon]
MLRLVLIVWVLAIRPAMLVPMRSRIVKLTIAQNLAAKYGLTRRVNKLS